MKRIQLSRFAYMTGLFAALAMLLVTTAIAKSSNQYPANNTGLNSRDADGSTITPEDQGGNPEDLKLIQNLRQSIVEEDTLSMNAKNVKIIAVNGKLTLRGPVNSLEEKNLIKRKAGDVAGLENVDDQLEIITP